MEYKPLSDDDIVKMVDDNIRTSTGYYDSQLSRERQKTQDYYNATLPKPAHDGNSRYVSQDVYNAVQSMTASLLETFSAGSNIVKFAPEGPEDVELSKVCSSYTNFILFRQNDAFSVFQSVIHDGLMARVGVCKVYWMDKTETETQTFENLTQDELDMLLADEGVELVDSESDDIGLLSGEIGIERDASKVCIEALEPEAFIVEAQARSLEDSTFCAHRSRMTISELREMGYDDDLINSIGGDDNAEYQTDPEVLARYEGVDDNRGYNNNGYQDQVRSVMVHEAYIMLDKEGTGVAYLYKVMKAGGVLLECEAVDKRPFITFSPLPTPHSFYGANFADRLCDTQNARTVLTRSILDHAVITNNPRYMVTKGGLSNPRELIANARGGLVNVTRPDAITPMPQAPLNPFIFQTLKELQENAEENSGISSLTTGMNKDAVSKQNSAALVEQLATMSQQRQKVIARNFANQFVRPLFHEAYRLAVINESQEKIVDISGSYVRVDPSRWKEKRDVSVELHLGYGEQDREAQKMLAMHQLFSQDPAMQALYQLPNRYAMMKTVLENQGVLNVNDYLTSPDQLPPPQPDQAQQMQLQMAAKQIELQERQTQIAELKAQTDAQIAGLKMELEKAKAEAQHALQSDNQDLKEEQFEHKRMIDEGELEILRRNTTDVRGIASPTG